jgi:hypothetical protein
MKVDDRYVYYIGDPAYRSDAGSSYYTRRAIEVTSYDSAAYDGTSWEGRCLIYKGSDGGNYRIAKETGLQVMRGSSYAMWHGRLQYERPLATADRIQRILSRRLSKDLCEIRFSCRTAKPGFFTLGDFMYYSIRNRHGNLGTSATALQSHGFGRYSSVKDGCYSKPKLWMRFCFYDGEKLTVYPYVKYGKKWDATCALGRQMEKTLEAESLAYT